MGKGRVRIEREEVKKWRREKVRKKGRRKKRTN